MSKRIYWSWKDGLVIDLHFNLKASFKAKLKKSAQDALKGKGLHYDIEFLVPYSAKKVTKKWVYDNIGHKSGEYKVKEKRKLGKYFYEFTCCVGDKALAEQLKQDIFREMTDVVEVKGHRR
jgi:hypothetical protein